MLNGLALCAGVGGIELGLKLAIGEDYRTICYVEREAYAAAALVARMEDAALDSAPIWDDLTTFDGGHWRGIVDIITAGFPCQPFSYAGKREGVNDDRWLWPDIERIIQQVRPGYIFLENVPGLFTSGFGHVLGSLASLGFNAEWDVFSACRVGAPHTRDRVFILAYAKGVLGPIGLGDGPLHREAIPEGHNRSSEGVWGLEPVSGVCGISNGAPARVDRLQAIGNGVVPLVEAVAFRELWSRRVSACLSK